MVTSERPIDAYLMTCIRATSKWIYFISRFLTLVICTRSWSHMQCQLICVHVTQELDWQQPSQSYQTSWGLRKLVICVHVIRELDWQTSSKSYQTSWGLRKLVICVHVIRELDWQPSSQSYQTSWGLRKLVICVHVARELENVDWVTITKWSLTLTVRVFCRHQPPPPPNGPQTYLIWYHWHYWMHLSTLGLSI